MAGIHNDSDRDFARQMFVDFDEEVGYWASSYRSFPFYRNGMTFPDYEPAIKLGINVFLRSHGRSFAELRDQLHESYQRTRNGSPLEWSEASAAAGAAWERMAGRLASRISRHATRDRTPKGPETIRPGARPRPRPTVGRPLPPI